MNPPNAASCDIKNRNPRVGSCSLKTKPTSWQSQSRGLGNTKKPRVSSERNVNTSRPVPWPRPHFVVCLTIPDEKGRKRKTVAIGYGSVSLLVFALITCLSSTCRIVWNVRPTKTQTKDTTIAHWKTRSNASNVCHSGWCMARS